MSDHEPGREIVTRSNGDESRQHPAAALDVRTALDIVRRRWWLILGALLLSVGATLWRHHNQLPQYTAQALLQQRTPTPLMPGGWEGELQVTDFGTLLEVLGSRTVLAPAVDSLGLQLDLRNRHAERSRIIGSVKVDRQPPRGVFEIVARAGRFAVVAAGDTIATAAAGSPVEGPGFSLTLASTAVAREPVRFTLRDYDEAITSLQRRITVEQGKGADLIHIQFTDPDPVFAANVVNVVAGSYREYRAGLARAAARRRRDVIANQLVALADSVRSVQGGMLQYQERSGLLDPQLEGNALLSARLQTENDLRTLRFQEGMLESLAAGLRTAGNDTESLQEMMVMGRDLVPAGESLHQRLQELEAERIRLTASRFGLTASSPEVQVIDDQIAGVRNQMRVAASQALEMMRARIRLAQARLGELQLAIGSLPERNAEFDRRQQQVDAVQRVFDQLVNEYYEAQIAEGVETGDIQLVDPATVPLAPNPSRKGLNLLIALMAGLVVGGLGAAGLEAFDNRIYHARDAQRVALLRVIGTVPNFRARLGGAKSVVVGREAFRAIHTSLRFSPDRMPRVLAVTSPAPGDGKSTVSVNLALTLVEQGLRVLLIDADFRHPSIHRAFNVRNDPGLSDVLAGRVPIHEAVRPLSNLAGLHMLSSGISNVDPANLTSSNIFARIIEHLRQDYDAILIDTPPILAVANAVAIAALADGALVVARSHRTDSDSLIEAVDLLRRTRIPLAGLVLNAVPVSRTDYYRYYSYHAHQAKEKDRRRVAVVVRPQDPVKKGA